MKYAVVVCDDDPSQAAALVEMVKHAQMFLSDEEKVEFDFKLVGHSFDEVADYLAKQQLNGAIYFLDIELSDQPGAKDGLDLAELAKKYDPRAQIVIATTHEELALMTFQRRIGPIDYIVKGDQTAMQQRITETLTVAIKNLAKLNLAEKQTFSYKLGPLVKNINTDDVLYISTSEFPHKLRLVKTNGNAEFVGDIKEIAEKNDFLLKISRSCLINPKNIDTIDLKQHLVSLENGDVLPYSRRQVKTMRELVKQYEWNEAKLEE